MLHKQVYPDSKRTLGLRRLNVSIVIVHWVNVEPTESNNRQHNPNHLTMSGQYSLCGTVAKSRTGNIKLWVQSPISEVNFSFHKSIYMYFIYVKVLSTNDIRIVKS